MTAVDLAGRRAQYRSREHVEGRARALRNAKPTDPCARCGLPLGRALVTSPSTIHYDHTDDRTGYLGLSHGRCDARAGAVNGGRAVQARRRGEDEGGGWVPVRSW